MCLLFSTLGGVCWGMAERGTQSPHPLGTFSVIHFQGCIAEQVDFQRPCELDKNLAKDP